MNVNLNSELEKFIEDEVRCGRSNDPNEFLNKAVYHYLLARDLGQDFTAQQVDALIVEGLEEIERGDVIDGEEAFRQLRARNAERRQSRA
jgi:Arc/MetJ-type ribon-helix-helix transcriptional regulator